MSFRAFSVFSPPMVQKHVQTAWVLALSYEFGNNMADGIAVQFGLLLNGPPPCINPVTPLWPLLPVLSTWLLLSSPHCVSDSKPCSVRPVHCPCHWGSPQTMPWTTLHGSTLDSNGSRFILFFSFLQNNLQIFVLVPNNLRIRCFLARSILIDLLWAPSCQNLMAALEEM